jgi:hypothetical protein
MISFIIGLFVGSFIGVVLMALLAMAKDYEPKEHEPEQKEPTRMWMVGNLCKFEGDVYEIKSFMEINGQTHVRLSHYDTGSSLSVPVEELEEVE